MKKLLHAADSRVEVSSRMGSVGLWLMLLVETPGPVKEFALGERYPMFETKARRKGRPRGRVNRRVTDVGRG